MPLLRFFNIRISGQTMAIATREVGVEFIIDKAVNYHMTAVFVTIKNRIIHHFR